MPENYTSTLTVPQFSSSHSTPAFMSLLDPDSLPSRVGTLEQDVSRIRLLNSVYNLQEAELVRGDSNANMSYDTAVANRLILQDVFHRLAISDANHLNTSIYLPGGAWAVPTNVGTEITDSSGQPTLAVLKLGPCLQGGIPLHGKGRVNVHRTTYDNFGGGNSNAGVYSALVAVGPDPVVDTTILAFDSSRFLYLHDLCIWGVPILSDPIRPNLTAWSCTRSQSCVGSGNHTLERIHFAKCNQGVGLGVASSAYNVGANNDHCTFREIQFDRCNTGVMQASANVLGHGFQDIVFNFVSNAFEIRGGGDLVVDKVFSGEAIDRFLYFPRLTGSPNPAGNQCKFTLRDMRFDGGAGGETVWLDMSEHENTTSAPVVWASFENWRALPNSTVRAFNLYGRSRLSLKEYWNLQPSDLVLRATPNGLRPSVHMMDSLVNVDTMPEAIDAASSIKPYGMKWYDCWDYKGTPGNPTMFADGEENQP